jgi:hypothetical protein
MENCAQSVWYIKRDIKYIASLRIHFGLESAAAAAAEVPVSSCTFVDFLVFECFIPILKLFMKWRNRLNLPKDEVISLY